MKINNARNTLVCRNIFELCYAVQGSDTTMLTYKPWPAHKKINLKCILYQPIKLLSLINSINKLSYA